MTAQLSFLPDPIDQATTATAPERLTPREKWARACELNLELPGVFASTARQLIEKGVRASANKVAEEIRDRYRTVGDEYAFNNTWRTPAAEELRETHPELAVHMKSRKGSR